MNFSKIQITENRSCLWWIHSSKCLQNKQAPNELQHFVWYFYNRDKPAIGGVWSSGRIEGLSDFFSLTVVLERINRYSECSHYRFLSGTKAYNTVFLLFSGHDLKLTESYQSSSAPGWFHLLTPVSCKSTTTPSPIRTTSGLQAEEGVVYWRQTESEAISVLLLLLLSCLFQTSSSL